MGDKHGTAVPHAANIAIAGRLLASWPRRLGVLTISPMWNPVLLAEQIATLAAMATQLDVVVALGEGADHFASVGIPATGRVDRLVGGLSVMRALVAGETVTADVGPHSIRNARVSIGAGSTPEWLIAASALGAIERAARVADGWLASARRDHAELTAGCAAVAGSVRLATCATRPNRSLPRGRSPHVLVVPDPSGQRPGRSWTGRRCVTGGRVGVVSCVA